MGILLLLLLAITLVITIKSVIVVKQAEVIIIERLGKYYTTLEPGLNIIMPIFDVPRGISWKTTTKGMDGRSFSYTSEKQRIDLRETVLDFPRQVVITKDNASISINAVLYFQIVNPRSAVYEVQNLPDAIEKLTQTTLRNLVGQLDLDETLTSRDKINSELSQILDQATNKWGVKVNRVELQDIIPPVDIQTSMEKQMKAERDRRAAILEAEGMKTSAILKAEGEKEAAINKAQGLKQAEILRAEGQAQARLVEAEAEKEAIRRITDAFNHQGQPDKYLIAMKYLESLEAISKGQDNKVVYMPYEATGILSSIDGIKQMLNNK